MTGAAPGARPSMTDAPATDPTPRADAELLLEIPRSDVEVLRVTREAYRGRPYLSLRVFFKTEGVWLPTKKGVSIRLRELRAVRDALTALLDRLEPGGP